MIFVLVDTVVATILLCYPQFYSLQKGDGIFFCLSENCVSCLFRQAFTLYVFKFPAACCTLYKTDFASFHDYQD